MKAWGVEFDKAPNGIEIVEFVQKNNWKYDLCLMDVEIPEMNSIAAAKRIKEHDYVLSLY